MRLLHRDDGGQALIAVALAMVVLLGAVGLGLDWGLALTQRRVAQNAADAAAMGAARWLATSVVLSGGSLAFAVYQEQLYCYAKGYADTDHGSFAPAGNTTTLVLEYGDGATPTNWTQSAQPSSCPAGSGGTTVPANTIYARATSGETYRSTIAAMFGMPQIAVQARAKARMAGTGVPVGFRMWPMVRHFNSADFDLGNCSPPCDPSQLPPLTFWSATGSLNDMVYGNFKGLVDFSRWSTRFAVPVVPQLIEDWDRTGSILAGTLPKPDMSGNCGGLWDTHGDSDPSNHDKQCSNPNWFYYPFGGRLSLTEDWSSSVPVGQETPSDIGARSSGVCSRTVPGLVAPSCAAGSDRDGDWVETAFGNLGSNVSDLILQYIAEHGKTTPRSNELVPGSSRTSYGKALVMYVYLWDCAETFNSSQPLGSQWDLVLPKSGDCSQVKDGSSIPTIDRVHLFTVAPFTFYEGLVTTSTIQGFWGGAFGDPWQCQADPATCRALDAFTNTAFLVADD